MTHIQRKMTSKIEAWPGISPATLSQIVLTMDQYHWSCWATLGSSWFKCLITRGAPSPLAVTLDLYLSLGTSIRLQLGSVWQIFPAPFFHKVAAQVCSCRPSCSHLWWIHILTKGEYHSSKWHGKHDKQLSMIECHFIASKNNISKQTEVALTHPEEL